MATKLLKNLPDNPPNQKYAKIYYDKILTAVKIKSPKELMMRQWVNMMIKKIKYAKQVVETEGYVGLHPKVQEEFDAYDIIHEEGIKLLLKSNGTQPAKEIVAFEDSYPYVAMSHIATGHGDAQAMAEWLSQSSLLVADICCSVLLKLCVKCQTRRFNIPAKETRKSVVLNIVDMSEIRSPKINLDCLLIYQDKDTKFLQLRPMNSAELINSVSNELTQLFSDLGPPDCVTVGTPLHSVFSKIVNERLNILFKTKMELKICDTSTNKVTQEVYTAIDKWADRRKRGKWCLGCFKIQWEINNKCDEGKKSPFEKVLGRKCDNIVYDDNTENTARI